MLKAVRRSDTVLYDIYVVAVGFEGADGNKWWDTTNASQVVVVSALVFAIPWPTVV
jgi:hypothetical protein